MMARAGHGLPRFVPDGNAQDDGAGHDGEHPKGDPVVEVLPEYPPRQQGGGDFSRREAPEAGMLESPSVSSTGPTIPSKTIAPTSGGSSRRCGCAVGESRIRRMRPRQSPEPQ
jgi:hypothetical protein